MEKSILKMENLLKCKICPNSIPFFPDFLEDKLEYTLKVREFNYNFKPNK